jgi:hypothetical protein
MITTPNYLESFAQSLLTTIPLAFTRARFIPVESQRDYAAANLSILQAGGLISRDDASMLLQLFDETVDVGAGPPSLVNPDGTPSVVGYVRAAIAATQKATTTDANTITTVTAYTDLVAAGTALGGPGSAALAVAAGAAQQLFHLV